MFLPAYLFSAGLGSKVSTWLTPPSMNIQITLLALGGKCGLPSGGAQVSAVGAALASRWSIAPSTSPVRPMPQSARNTLRLGVQHPGDRATDFKGCRSSNFMFFLIESSQSPSDLPAHVRGPRALSGEGRSRA